MRKNIVSLVMAAVILVLELLPYGAVLIFARPPEEGEGIRRTFSYFSLTPFGYANFGPLLTAVLSCLLFLLILLSVFIAGQKLRGAVIAFSAAGFVTSLMPLLFGLAYYTAIGAAISALLAAEGILWLTMKKEEKREK